MNEKTGFSAKIYAALIAYALSLYFSYLYILTILSIMLYVLITIRRALMVNMVKTGVASSILYLYGAAAFAVFMTRDTNVDLTLAQKIMVGPSVWALGASVTCSFALLNAGWYRR